MSKLVKTEVEIAPVLAKSDEIVGDTPSEIDLSEEALNKIVDKVFGDSSLPPMPENKLVSFAAGGGVRLYSLGLGPERVAAGQLLTLTVTPNTLFKPETLVNLLDEGFRVLQFSVGSRIQGPRPAEYILASDLFAWSKRKNFDACSPGIMMAVMVVNITKQDREFAMNIVGRIL